MKHATKHAHTRTHTQEETHILEFVPKITLYTTFLATNSFININILILFEGRKELRTGFRFFD